MAASTATTNAAVPKFHIRIIREASNRCSTDSAVAVSLDHLLALWFGRRKTVP